MTLLRLAAIPAVILSFVPHALAAPPREVAAAIAKMPLLFVANEGQLDRRVGFVLQATDKTLYFTPSGVTLLLHGKIRREAVKLTFPGARPGVRPEGLDPAATTFSFWRGERGVSRSGVPTYTRLVYRDLWPGIDLEYAVQGHALKYTFHVRPGADPDRIRLAYRGAERLVHTAADTLAIETPDGGFEDARPIAFQRTASGSVDVPVRYAIVPATAPGVHEHSFDLGAYDPTLPLELDPAMVVYAGFFAATDSVGTCGRGGGIAVDRDGNAYVTGNTNNEPGTFPPLIGPITTYGDNTDAFVAKIGVGGNIVYAGFYGSSTFETGDAIASDPDGNVYLLGSGTNMLPNITGPMLPPATGGIYIAKIAADGSGVAWTRLIPGNRGICPRALAADANGNAYAAGFTNSDESVFPVMGGPTLHYNGQTNDGDDAFVVKVNSGGAIVYAGFLGGTKVDEIDAIAADDDGNAYAAGVTASSENDMFPATLGPDLTYNGGDTNDILNFGDAFVAKIGPAGSIVFCGYIGSTGFDEGTGVAVDASRNVYVAGSTKSSSSFPTSIGPNLTTKALDGSQVPFIVKVASTGTTIGYAGFVGNATGENVRVGVDAGNNAYVAGTTTGGPDDYPAGGVGATRLGTYGDVFVAKVPASGMGLEWSTFFGGSSENLDGMAVHSTGDVFLFGSTFADASSFPVKGGPLLTKTASFSDQFYVARINGTPGNGPGGGPSGGGSCADIASCQAALTAALPDPAAAANAKSRKVAKQLGTLDHAADASIARGINATGKKHTRFFRRARGKLAKLVSKARAADGKGTLGIALSPIEGAATQLISLLQT
ncbi:MAG TPA: SBBP repeat-containing protein [Candidatus Eisenbacteria bacterium]|nr:SBBP repeat-containing protein [Candidatus Eisenbacteria bacterium]